MSLKTQRSFTMQHCQGCSWWFWWRWFVIWSSLYQRPWGSCYNNLSLVSLEEHTNISISRESKVNTSFKKDRPNSFENACYYKSAYTSIYSQFEKFTIFFIIFSSFFLLFCQISCLFYLSSSSCCKAQAADEPLYHATMTESMK